MIRVVLGTLASQTAEALLRPVRTDMAPVSAASRDIAIAAGEQLEERLSRLGTLPLGGAVLTPAGNLDAAYLIHAVVMSEEEQQTSLIVQRALRNGLRRATDWGLASLALPPLGLGVGTADPEGAARTLVEILFNHVDEGFDPLDLTIVAGSKYEAELLEGLVDELSRARSSLGDG
ncbi:MAG: macro domain-containing protein [Longimicrobiales bacterium]